MAKEIKDMTKPELLSHIATLNETIAQSGDAQALSTALETIATQEKTIGELMSKVATLDAEPKVKTATIKIGKVEHKLLVPKSYIRTAEGEPMEVCTIETCKENEAVQQAAIDKGLLVPVTE